MTVQEIYNELLSKGIKNINLLTVRRRINEAVDFFSSKYDRMYVKSVVYISCADTSIYYDIPAESVGISKVLDSDNMRCKYFETLNNTIKFDNTDNYSLIIKLKPNLQNTKDNKILASEVLNVNPLFVRPIIFYILSTVIEDAKASQGYLNTAMSLAEDANFMARKQDSANSKTIPVRPFR